MLRGNVFRAIETQKQFDLSSGTTRDSLQFNVSFPRKGLLHHMLRWDHPDLLRLMKYCDISLFVDGTFKVAPTLFKKCVITIMYDVAHDHYILCLYIFGNGRDDWIYWHVMHWLSIACDMRLKPSAVVYDFETALQLAIRDQFPSTNIIRCLFHLKQALRRNMLKENIPTEEVKVTMYPG